MQFHIPYHLYQDKYSSKRSALYHALRDCIVNGVLAGNTKLPSSRELAQMYDMSRGTVSQVYDMLSSDGYVTGGVGKGTFVLFQHPQEKRGELTHEGMYTYSDWGNRLNALEGWGRPEIQRGGINKEDNIDFGDSRTCKESFPFKEWNHCLYGQIRTLAYDDPQHTETSALGDADLRESIAQYLRRARGIAVSAEQVGIFNGSMQALALTLQLFINAGDRVVVESPGYRGVARAISGLGGVCINAPLDVQGIIPADWEAKLLFITPNRQFPTGAVLPLERRQQLLEWASRNNALILEDDYDSEFRHHGKSLEPLKALDHEGRVIYLGSFSNTMPSNVRIGYVVIPQPLIELFQKAKSLFDPQPCNLLEQRTLAFWMKEGGYERHLRRMKRIYGRKFKLLREQLHSSLSSLFTWIEGDAGLSIFGWWRGSSAQYEVFRSLCAAAGIRWSDTYITNAEDDRTRYGAYFFFPTLSEEQIVDGVARMANIGSQMRD